MSKATQHILITSGGTSVPIDPVRNITNSSSGRFGAALAAAALEAGMSVTYLVAQQGESPFALRADFNVEPDLAKQQEKLKKYHAFYEKYHRHYHEIRFQSYADYAAKLKKIITEQKPTIVMLAAAVSDYLVANYADTKIRSNESLTIELSTAPKLIREIKNWLPDTFLVGFKLLVNVTDEALIAAARQSIKTNKLNMCVANDLASLQRHAHEVILVNANGTSQKITNHLASTIIAECLAQVK